MCGIVFHLEIKALFKSIEGDPPRRVTPLKVA